MLYSGPGVFLMLLVLQAAAERCTTPNNEQAECVSLYYSCPILIDALATKQNASIEFVRKSNCGGTAVDPMVCCGSSSAVRENKTSPHKGGSQITNNLLPDRRYCGYQHADDYYHPDNISTGLDEFPWFAGLLHEVGNTTKIFCGGSLITNRYVLTSANCVWNGLSYNLVGVRLGEYQDGTEKDCIDNPQFEECTNPPEDFDFEKIIIHPMYSGITTFRNGDIALIRLNRTVTYSDFIRPICLPTPGTKFSKIGDTLTTTGWTHSQHDSKGLPKEKFSTKLISNDECEVSWAQSSLNVTENLFCTKEQLTFSCLGGNGGPIMFSFRSQWHLEGIGTDSMGCLYGMVDVHTKVVHYLDWIQENIEP